MNPIGIIGSFIYPFFFVNPDSKPHAVKEQVQILMISYALIAALWLLLSFLTYYENGQSPQQKLEQAGDPDASLEEPDSEEQISISD
jgi:hypothetical protein